MVIRKVLTVGAVLGITLPPAHLHQMGLHRGDLVSLEYGNNDEITIRRVDLVALAQQRAQNDRPQK